MAYVTVHDPVQHGFGKWGAGGLELEGTAWRPSAGNVTIVYRTLQRIYFLLPSNSLKPPAALIHTLTP